ncbi:MAG: MaoC family dehydratase N-terminal domain-containing protein [Halioglobus sp.]|nr:MaoC family dehydratase N-terminal domain-containing protein [Halioglobus sp.]
MSEPTAQNLDSAALTGERLGPYCSFNPVSRVQVWQWCCALGDRNPLYLDDAYRAAAGFDRIVAPPGMMQMWTMRDIDGGNAPGSTDRAPFEVFDLLRERGLEGNVAVSYDIEFHRLLVEGDRAHHYSTVDAISELKQTSIGEGHFVTQRAEFMDQHERPYATALITYFQYRPAADTAPDREQSAGTPPAPTQPAWRPDFVDVRAADLNPEQELPELVLPITHKLIVGGALASQDYMDVHHNAPAARAAGMPDIFMNILTTCGLSARYLTDWAGPGSRIRKLRFKLLAPNTPGDTMILRGRVANVSQSDGGPRASVDFSGANSRGMHVTGAAVVDLAG